MKCFPELLDEKNYPRFSLIMQIPRTQPFSVESEPPRWWPGVPSVFQVPSVPHPSGKFGKHCLQVVGTEKSCSALVMVKSNTSLSILDVLSAGTHLGQSLMPSSRLHPLGLSC